ncbi:hypothetical protein EDD63_1186 [Breznakia blatticola]|uniref:Uncharacterized protein n=1 Tax=Breznakia blatticola TaxID=1754012 RepID=A0A4R7ZGX9_9FIRM|nr:hypothetical protein [Breznakia blatticola]TDW16939.1 hypothetical protein EDD63_1186 [Breznakia blatticola]
MQLVLPKQFVAYEQTHELVDGQGFYINNKNLRMIAFAVCSNPYNVSSLAWGIRASAGWVAAKCSAFGPLGVAVGAFAATFLVAGATGFASSAVTALSRGKGVSVGIGWAWGFIPYLSTSVR